MTCENDDNLATYELTMVSVSHEGTTMRYCTECAAGLANMVFANNDASFAGPEHVVELLAFRLLSAEQFRSMAADPDRRSWCDPCHPGEFICLLVTGRDGDSYSVGVRRTVEKIVWMDVPPERITLAKQRLRAEGLTEIEMIADGRPHPEYRIVP